MDVVIGRISGEKIDKDIQSEKKGDYDCSTADLYRHIGKAFCNKGVHHKGKKR